MPKGEIKDPPPGKGGGKPDTPAAPTNERPQPADSDTTRGREATRESLGLNTLRKDLQPVLFPRDLSELNDRARLKITVKYDGMDLFDIGFKAKFSVALGATKVDGAVAKTSFGFGTVNFSRDRWAKYGVSQYSVEGVTLKIPVGSTAVLTTYDLDLGALRVSGVEAGPVGLEFGAGGKTSLKVNSDVGSVTLTPEAGWHDAGAAAVANDIDRAIMDLYRFGGSGWVPLR